MQVAERAYLQRRTKAQLITYTTMDERLLQRRVHTVPQIKDDRDPISFSLALCLSLPLSLAAAVYPLHPRYSPRGYRKPLAFCRPALSLPSNVSYGLCRDVSFK